MKATHLTGVSSKGAAFSLHKETSGQFKRLEDYAEAGVGSDEPETGKQRREGLSKGTQEVLRCVKERGVHLGEGVMGVGGTGPGQGREALCQMGAGSCYSQAQLNSSVLWFSHRQG